MSKLHAFLIAGLLFGCAGRQVKPRDIVLVSNSAVSSCSTVSTECPDLSKTPITPQCAHARKVCIMALACMSAVGNMAVAQNDLDLLMKGDTTKPLPFSIDEAQLLLNGAESAARGYCAAGGWR